MKQVLIETQFFTAKPLKLVEGTVPTSNPLVEGILATCEVKNGNGRYYSRDLWEREIDKYMENVRANRALGELDHPDSSIINLKNVSHNIKKIWWDGDHVMGAIEILPTPSGNILSALFQNNIPVGVSSRGMGSLKQMGDLMEVQDDFELLCWDFVSTPSNPGSYMKEVGMMNESKLPQQTNKYIKVNSVITDILCANGTCPIF
jgi:hypothetical protein